MLGGGDAVFGFAAGGVAFDQGGAADQIIAGRVRAPLDGVTRSPICSPS